MMTRLFHAFGKVRPSCSIRDTVHCPGDMSLRTRLIIAFLLLSVVPLSAVTFFTYRAWVETFEAAARREASQSALDIGRRMERITADVGRRMDRLFDPGPGAAAAGRASNMRERVAPTLGDTAALVERVEFYPAASPDAPSPPGPPAPGAGRAGSPPFEGPPGFDPQRRGRGRGLFVAPFGTPLLSLLQVIVVEV